MTPEAPWQHFAIIYLDHTNQLKTQKSSSIFRPVDQIFTPDFCQRFKDSITDKPIKRTTSNKESSSRTHALLQPKLTPASPSNSLETSPKGTRMETLELGGGRVSDRLREERDAKQSHNNETIYPTSTQKRNAKRRSKRAQRKMEISASRRSNLRVDDDEAMDRYYDAALTAFQQVNCKQIAKEYIDVIEPQKKSKHPYKGGAENKPSETKPEWWPKDVQHKGPHHLQKNERRGLLIHILRNPALRNEPHNVTTDKLREASLLCKTKISSDHHWDILEEIYRVNYIEERYLKGELDESAEIPVDGSFGAKSEVTTEGSVPAISSKLGSQPTTEPTRSTLPSSTNRIGEPENQSISTTVTDQKRLDYGGTKNISFVEQHMSPRDSLTWIVPEEEYFEDHSQMPQASTNTSIPRNLSPHGSSAFNFMTAPALAAPETGPASLPEQDQMPYPLLHHQSTVNGWRMLQPPCHTVASGQGAYQRPFLHPPLLPFEGLHEGHLQDQTPSAYGLPSQDLPGPAVDQDYAGPLFPLASLIDPQQAPYQNNAELPDYNGNAHDSN